MKVEQAKQIASNAIEQLRQPLPHSGGLRMTGASYSVEAPDFLLCWKSNRAQKTMN